MFLLLGISLLLAALLGSNCLAAVSTAVVWKVAGRFIRQCSANTQARAFFWLRVLPTGLGAAVILILVTPAYLQLEPRSTNETVSLKLGTIALASALGIVLSFFRSIATWRATAHLAADWLAHAEAISIPQSGIPAYRIEHRFPVIAIVGIWRPRLFLGAKIFDSLTADEISAAVQHEIGHLGTRDNLKRTLLRACTDLTLFVPCGRAIDAAWSSAAEAAADEHAGRQSRKVALDLASALVKISRMIPAGTGPAMPAGSFLVRGEETLGVPARVRRLLEIASADSQPSLHGPLIAYLEVWTCLGLLFLLVALLSSRPQVLTTVHALMEQVVSFLS